MGTSLPSSLLQPARRRSPALSPFPRPNPIPARRRRARHAFAPQRTRRLVSWPMAWSVLSPAVGEGARLMTVRRHGRAAMGTEGVGWRRCDGLGLRWNHGAWCLVRGSLLWCGRGCARRLRPCRCSPTAHCPRSTIVRRSPPAPRNGAREAARQSRDASRHGVGEPITRHCTTCSLHRSSGWRILSTVRMEASCCYVSCMSRVASVRGSGSPTCWRREPLGDRGGSVCFSGRASRRSPRWLMSSLVGHSTTAPPSPRRPGWRWAAVRSLEDDSDRNLGLLAAVRRARRWCAIDVDARRGGGSHRRRRGRDAPGPTPRVAGEAAVRVSATVCAPTLILFGWFYVRNVVLYGDFAGAERRGPRIAEPPTSRSICDVLASGDICRETFEGLTRPSVSAFFGPIDSYVRIAVDVAAIAAAAGL